MKVTYEQVTESGLHKFFVDASELGLRPGEWPETIKTDMGNGQPFILRTEPNRCGAGCWYTQANGCIELTVFND